MKTIIKNGLIYDGTGGEPYKGAVLIQDDVIADIGALEGVEADSVIDVEGKAVAPGFIDAHSHNDWFLMRSDTNRFFEPFVEQGITTQVTGNCGFSPFGFDKGTQYEHLLGSGLFENVGKHGDPSTLAGFASACGSTAVNIVPLYGHMSGRIGIAGYDSRELTEKELARQDEITEQALIDGAAGISFGLMYEPDRYAPYSELKRAAKLAAKHDKLITVHARACSAVSTSYSPPAGGRAHNLRALDEMAQLARETGAKIQFSHLIFVGSRSWGTVDESLEIINKLNSEGLEFYYDSYAMTYGASIITVALPAWYLGLPKDKRGTLGVRARLNVEIGMTKMLLGFNFSDIVLAWVGDGHDELVGKSVTEIAKMWGVSDMVAYLRLVDLSEGKGRVLMYKYLTEDILSTLMHDKKCLYMTDAWLEEKGMQNPAAFNCYPRFLQLARTDSSLGLPYVIRQMTGATADRFKLDRRGYVKQGNFADITVFDQDKVAPSADPNGRPTGIKYVFINGSRVLCDGKAELNASGRMLLR